MESENKIFRVLREYKRKVNFRSSDSKKATKQAKSGGKTVSEPDILN